MQATTTGHTLELRRRYRAPASLVFQALTDPGMLPEWFGPSTHEVLYVQVDLRVGGRYKITMRKKPDGDPFHVSGEYIEVQPDRRLVYTWAWSNHAMGPNESRVTMDLSELGEETELVLTHELFATAQERDGHNQGWSASFDRLQALVNERD